MHWAYLPVFLLTFGNNVNQGVPVSTGHEVIIPASGETEIDIARASFVEKTGVFLGGDLNILKPNEGVDPAFLAIEISNGGTKKELSAKAQGKTIVHLHKDDIITLKICLPKDDEQKRISWFFDCFDQPSSFINECLFK
jgi:type I restriction enzyme S subunit